MKRIIGYNPNEFDVYAGLDVDKKSIAVTLLDRNGEIVQCKMPYDAKRLMAYVERRYPDKRVAFVYESGPTGYGLYDDLRRAEQCCLVVAPCKVARVPGRSVKTNRLDSEDLSIGLRGGQIKGIHVPSEQYRELRHLVQMRDTLVDQARATKQRIKSFLLFHGIPFPGESEERWTCSAMKQLKELDCSAAQRFHLDQLLDSLEFFNAQVRKTTQAIRGFCKSDEEISRDIGYVCTISGIGFITASQLIARIGSPAHLCSPNQIGAYLGLVPREHSTGDDVRKGSITKAGNGRLRSKLIQCAWLAIRQDEELKSFYEALYQRNKNSCGARKAITAVARKLTTRIYAVLVEQRPYVVRSKESAKHE